MDPERMIAQLLLVFAGLVYTGDALSCYSCHSAEPGCGKELSIRLERWHSCPDAQGGENFCVKLVEKVGSEEYITRGCLETFRRDTYHRQQLPTIQRHGYCEPARQNDPWNPYDKNTVYCFCNDWNGCNSAPGRYRVSGVTTSLAVVVIAVLRFVL